MFKPFTGVLMSLAVVSSVQAAVPNEIIFNNQTALALHTSIAGKPGQGVAANSNKALSYYFVTVGCYYYSSNKFNCPIEFTDTSNGAKVATVYINSETATLTQPPIFYGNYANEYEVVGWQTSPLQEITISKKT